MKITMSPDRFNQCLRVIRWTPINIASALQCELSWIEALEAGNERGPARLAGWLETFAQAMRLFRHPSPTDVNGRPSHRKRPHLNNHQITYHETCLHCTWDSKSNTILGLAAGGFTKLLAKLVTKTTCQRVR